MREVQCSECGAKNRAGAKYCSECGTPLGSPLRNGNSPKPKPSSAAGWVFVSLMVAVPFGFVLCAFAGGSVEGEIRSSGKPNGDFLLKPTECHSGAHENFFGAWVTPKLVRVNGRQGFQGGIKFVKNHLTKWDVYLESPVECKGLECTVRPVERAHCRVFDVDVRDTGTVVNDIRLREGHATLDCSFPDGGKLAVKLKFDGCD